MSDMTPAQRDALAALPALWGCVGPDGTQYTSTTAKTRKESQKYASYFFEGLGLVVIPLTLAAMIEDEKAGAT